MTATERAACELASDLKKFGIEVDGYHIRYRGKMQTLPFGTPRTEARKILKEYIKKAQDIESGDYPMTASRGRRP